MEQMSEGSQEGGGGGEKEETGREGERGTLIDSPTKHRERQDGWRNG